MEEWLKVLVSGIAGVVIGFILMMSWDVIKSNRESKKREETVLSAAKEELESDFMILEYNLVTLEGDTGTTATLSRLQSGFWDLVKISLPLTLIKADTLAKIREVAVLTDLINEQIESREKHRIFNQEVSGYYTQIQRYDQRIREDSGVLLELLEELRPLL